MSAWSLKQKVLTGIGVFFAVAALIVGILFATRAIYLGGEGSYVLVEELWDSEDKRFNEDNVDILLKYLTGNQDATISDIEALATDKTDSEEIRQVSVNSGYQNGTYYKDKAASQNVNVMLGGLEWQVCYLSKDKNGNSILTLWMSDSYQKAFEGRAADEGEHYGYENGVLKTRWSANWSNAKYGSDVYYPSSLYGASYIRAATLNNGGRYSTGILEENYVDVEQNENSAFAVFTMDKFGLADYIVTPRDVAWQEYQSYRTYYNSSYSYANDAWGADIPNEGEFQGVKFKFNNNTTNGGYVNFSEKTTAAEGDNPKEANDVWADDKVWMPSYTELRSTKGMWKVNPYQSSDSGSSYFWAVRSAYSGKDAYYFYNNGASLSTSTVTNKYGCRPALHLNLTKAAERAEEKLVTFESNGGSHCEQKTYEVGGRYINLPVPTLAGKYFAGWYLEQDFITNITAETKVETQESVTLYAKWEDAGYIITYELDGGTLETLPNNIAIGTEFALQQPVKSGSKFAGWKILGGGGHPPSKR